MEEAFSAAGLRLIHVDDALLVVDKPSGLLSVPGRGAERQDCVAARVQRLCPEALVVHRLDMETSGLMLLARGYDAQRALSIAFQQRRVSKRYEALIAGQPQADGGEIDLPLITDWPNRPRQIVDFRVGKPSLTHYRVMARHVSYSRVELLPVTGRSHQLRVHLRFLGHPILGDSLYADPTAQKMAPRLQLHATDLSFEHPQSGRQIALNCPAPF